MSVIPAAVNQDKIPGIGDRAPDAVVIALQGPNVALSSLWQVAGRGLALVFLRHYGCSFCREHAKAIEARNGDFEDAGISVAFIGCGTGDEARDFRDALGLTYPLYNDPERVAYQAFGLGEAALGSMLNPRVIAGGIRAAAKGHLPKRSSGNPLQLQGQFLIDRKGVIRSISRPALMSEIPSATELLGEARQLGEGS